jgi:hypothetical protein
MTLMVEVELDDGAVRDVEAHDRADDTHAAICARPASVSSTSTHG